MEANSFRFKHFTVKQDGCAMKVGTDGVLLGAWCRIRCPEDKRLLDIGTGTGVIALQLAQKTISSGSMIYAVEIDGASCRTASGNFSRSDWNRRITLYEGAVQDFASEASFDHIVSNPPYFIDSLESPLAARNTARHTGSLSYEELMDACRRLLAPDGRISLVTPAAEGEKMIRTAVSHGFCVSRRTEVWSTPKSGPKRLLLEFSRETIEPETSMLVIEDAGPRSFSKEYRELTRDFYLYF